MKKPNPNGRIIYRGPSRLDGKPIVVVLTGLKPGKNENLKTGHMLQTHILVDTMNPHEAVATGADISICGYCPHRGVDEHGLQVKKRTCYVKLWRAPAKVYACLHTGSGYKTATTPQDRRALGRGAKIRLGAYGDPGAVPTAVWRQLTEFAESWTGYTHQWRRRPSLAALCMASADTVVEAKEAVAKGWRYFRVSETTDIRLGEVLCPASKEGGKKTVCASCGLCNGTESKAPKSIVIPQHA